MLLQPNLKEGGQREVLQQAPKASGERWWLRREEMALRLLCTAGAECKGPRQRKENTKRTTLTFTLVKTGWFRKALNREVTSSGTDLAGTYGYGGERSLQGDLTHRVCGMCLLIPLE